MYDKLFFQHFIYITLYTHTIILFHACCILFLSYISGYERSDNGSNEEHVEVEIYHRSGSCLG